MILADLQLVDENPAWSLVLQAYQQLETAAAEARAVERKKSKAAQNAGQPGEEPGGETADASAAFTENRWMARLFEVDGVPREGLASVHGQLIAHGFLNVMLSGRDGLVYQLTNLGKRATVSPEERAVDENEADGDSEAAAA